MNNNIEKENSQNQEEEETFDEASNEEQETSNEEQETPQEPDANKEIVFQKRLNQMYARLKKTEAENKELQAKLNIQPKTDFNIEDIAEEMIAFKGLNRRERTRLLETAKLKTISLKEARKDEDYGLWRSAYRQKMEKERTLKPSTKQGEQSLSFTEQLKNASLEEKEKLLMEQGLWNPPKRTHQPVKIM